MDAGEWKESDAETAVYIQKWVSALVHVAGLPEENNATLAVYKCTGPACVNVGKPFKIQAEFHCQIPDFLK